jgi:hypothetical protein
MFTRRVVTFFKMFVAGAGVATALSMGVIASLQFGFWLMAKTWTPFPVSRIVELSGIDVPRRYFPASADTSASGRPGTLGFVEWSLDLPAIVALFMALALFSLFYAALTSVEKGLATASGVDDAPSDVRGPR